MAKCLWFVYQYGKHVVLLIYTARSKDMT